jgi:hypothetical protein
MRNRKNFLRDENYLTGNEKNILRDGKNLARNEKNLLRDENYLTGDKKNLTRDFFEIEGCREKFPDNHTLIFKYRNTFIAFLIHPVSTFFDLAGMMPSCFPDVSVLFAAVNGVIAVPALSVTVRGNIPGAVPAGVRRRHSGIGDPFSRIDSIGNIIRQPHPW